MTRKDNEFVMELANACFHDDKTFEKVNSFFKNISEESKKRMIQSYSEEVIEKLISQAQKNRLNIYFQNVLCLA